ncbi:ligase-associated DNA damage response endonuclease PdeM [Stieleria sp. JC731]|uniref:ligase-associated DNA damage response endonuclease PdeM n=1 Tax=Pirellulaceae TaxID=2691357 RepID=UPI001E615D32|nr:ligase-associated DNA damage response endonuclease PdeM [Stieleria sp. JC731]MCC9599312.1 ligase-associated DNA damage response endonuclease PdeM [Stieleria sp. JC731]
MRSSISSVASSCDVVLRDHRLRLFSGGGVYHRDLEFLFVADLHLGKDATFRKHGLPVPSGGCAATLSKVECLIEQCRPSHLYLLGDMFHARSSVSDEVNLAMGSFRKRCGDLSMTLIRGNHDASFSKLPKAWGIESSAENVPIENLRLCHHPVEMRDDEGLALAGHLHPSYSLQTATERLGRLPCFWYSRGCLVLPAIGEFTGTYGVRHQSADDRIWVSADEVILEIPQ